MNTHFSPDFVALGGHRAVAEALNEGQCDALCRVLSHLVPASTVECVPLFVYCTRTAGSWLLTSLASASACEESVQALVRKRALREALLRHAPADVERVRRLLSAPPETLVVRLVVVFDDESSHVNAVVVRRGVADLFEPKGTVHDTPTRPFATLRAAIRDVLGVHGVKLHDPPVGTVLQTDDDLCQTWVAAYVAECVRRPHASPTALRRRLRPSPTCDRLCFLLRFSEEVYTSVPFCEATRRGRRIRTLAERRASTSRHFGADPRPCGPTS